MPFKHFLTITDSKTNDSITIAVVRYTHFHNVCVFVCGVCAWGTSFIMLFPKKKPHGLFPRAIAPLDRLFQRKFECLWGISYFPSSILHCPCGKKKVWDYRENLQ